MPAMGRIRGPEADLERAQAAGGEEAEVRVGAPSPETRLGAYDSWRLRTFAYVEPSWPSESLIVY